MTHKEFYIWLEGYLHGKLENKHIDIAPIVEKMGEVKEDIVKPLIKTYEQIPVPINPLPKTNDPYKSPYEITCETKTQLND